MSTRHTHIAAGQEGYYTGTMRRIEALLDKHAPTVEAASSRPPGETRAPAIPERPVGRPVVTGWRLSIHERKSGYPQIWLKCAPADLVAHGIAPAGRYTLSWAGGAIHLRPARPGQRGNRFRRFTGGRGYALSASVLRGHAPARPYTATRRLTDGTLILTPAQS